MKEENLHAMNQDMTAASLEFILASRTRQAEVEPTPLASSAVVTHYDEKDSPRATGTS